MAAFGFSLKLTRRGGPPSVRPALDVFAGTVYAAYGLARLLSTQAGPGVRVRRSSDGAEADIGFTPRGALDTAALLAFAGTGSAFAVAWYDQGGNGFHATQSVTASQPRLVNAGLLEAGPGGRPVMAFAGSHNLGIAGAAAFARNADHLTVGVAGSSSAVAGSSAFFSASKGGNLSWYRVAVLHTPTLNTARFAASGNDMDNPPFASQAYSPGAPGRFIGRVRFHEGGIDMVIDGASAAGALGTTTASVDSDSTVRIGSAPNGGAPLIGQISTLVLSRAALDLAALDSALQRTMP